MSFQRTVKMFQNIKNWNEYLVYKWTGKKADKFTFILRNGYKVTVPRRIIPEFKESCFEEVYLKRLPKKIQQKSNPTIIDIGANVGFFSIACIHKFRNPRIIAFEPVQRNFAELKNNTKEIPKANLEIVNQAVSDREGEIILKYDKTQSITTSASIFENQYGDDEEKVTSTTLEKIMAENKINEIDILKLDCEGAEYGIFYRTPKKVFDKIRSVALETHRGKGENENNDSLAKYVHSLGYTVKTSPGYIWGYK
jgi:FkbM family methyltransferase